jgi:hypothetical protein
MEGTQRAMTAWRSAPRPCSEECSIIFSKAFKSIHAPFLTKSDHLNNINWVFSNNMKFCEQYSSKLYHVGGEGVARKPLKNLGYHNLEPTNRAKWVRLQTKFTLAISLHKNLRCIQKKIQKPLWIVGLNTTNSYSKLYGQCFNAAATVVHYNCGC